MKKLLWIARIWSLLSISFILVFVIAHVAEPITISNITPKELIAIICFPLGTLTGLIMGWKKPKTGGFITIISVGILFILMPNTISSIWIPTLVTPGILFLIYGFLKSN